MDLTCSRHGTEERVGVFDVYYFGSTMTNELLGLISGLATHRPVGSEPP